jgi:hypothetical protein
LSDLKLTVEINYNVTVCGYSTAMNLDMWWPSAGMISKYFSVQEFLNSTINYIILT